MVVDTSIIIQHIRTKDKFSTIFYRYINQNEVFISLVTLYELHIGATTIGKEDNIQTLLQGINILPFTDLIALKAAKIYRQLKTKNQLIEFRDIFIAATCITQKLPIVTLNKKHFERIEGLAIV